MYFERAIDSFNTFIKRKPNRKRPWKLFKLHFVNALQDGFRKTSLNSFSLPRGNCAADTGPHTRISYILYCVCFSFSSIFSFSPFAGICSNAYSHFNRNSTVFIQVRWNEKYIYLTCKLISLCRNVKHMYLYNPFFAGHWKQYIYNAIRSI